MHEYIYSFLNKYRLRNKTDDQIFAFKIYSSYVRKYISVHVIEDMIVLKPFCCSHAYVNGGYIVHGSFICKNCKIFNKIKKGIFQWMILEKCICIRKTNKENDVWNYSLSSILFFMTLNKSFFLGEPQLPSQKD